MALLRDRKNAAQQLGTLASVSVAYAAKQKATTERALAIRERRYGRDHPAVAPWIVQVAESCTDPSEETRRRTLLERALSMQERFYGQEDPILVPGLTRLGAIKVASASELANGRTLLERALRLQEQAPATAAGVRASLIAILRELDRAYLKSKQDALRRVALDRLVKLLEEERNDDSLVLAQASFDLGELMIASNELEAARARLERALELQERPALRESVDSGPTFIVLGNLYYRMNNYAGSAKMLERALTYQEQHYGADHLIVVPTLTNLATAYLAMRHYKHARPLLERALAIEEKKYGAMHVNVIQIKTSLLTIPPHEHPLSKVGLQDFRCNLCSTVHKGTNPAYHCGTCNYDECPLCFDKSGSTEKKVGVAAKPGAGAGAGAVDPDAPPPHSGRKPVETFLMDDEPEDEATKKKKGGCCVVQ